MQTRLRVTAAAGELLIVLIVAVIGFAGDVSAQILLDNDITVDWQQCRVLGVVTASCRTPAFTGVPRTVTPRAEEGVNAMKIVVDIRGGALRSGILELSVYDEALQELCFGPTACRLSHAFTEVPVDGFSLADFDSADRRFPDDAILTVRGHLSLDVPPGVDPEVSITVTGDGNPIIINRVGDRDNFHPGDVPDIPSRSIALTRALNELATTKLARHALELDTSAPRYGGGVVGWTHSFVPRRANLPRSSLESAIITLSLSPNPCASNDFILFDSGVNNIAAGRGSRVPLVFVQDLPQCHVAGTAYTAVDLTSAPVRFLSLRDGRLSEPVVRDLTGDLRDGQLNVIVVGESAVDFSQLRITTSDPHE